MRPGQGVGDLPCPCLVEFAIPSLAQEGNRRLCVTMDSIAQGGYAGLVGSLQVPYRQAFALRTRMCWLQRKRLVTLLGLLELCC